MLLVFKYGRRVVLTRGILFSKYIDWYKYYHNILYIPWYQVMKRKRLRIKKSAQPPAVKDGKRNEEDGDEEDDDGEDEILGGRTLSSSAAQ
jgi:hypothetical protein